MRWFLFFSAALALIASPASSQQAADEEVDLHAVWFTTYECPEENGSGPGSRAAPIDLEHFDDAYDASAIHDEAETPGPRHAQFHCKWVRITGFMTWMDYYHYRGSLTESFGATYFSGDQPRYILERFVDGTPPRWALAQRRLTVVGRFYNLCFAADEARRAAGDDFWWLFGPCHYGANNGMMLTDVQVETVHDTAPVYLLGDMNRTPLGLMPTTEGAERAAIEEQVRAWINLLREGIHEYADQVIAGSRYLASAPEEERREARDRILSSDSYASYLTGDARFRSLNPRRAQLEIFWDGERRDSAYGCVCLEQNCANRWPLFTGDADEFLGAAACVELTRDDSGTWSWR